MDPTVPSVLRRAKRGPQVFLLRGLLASVLAVALGGCGQWELSEQEQLEKGRQAFLQGDLKTSSIEIKNVLQANPENAEARFLLGRIYLEAGDSNAAVTELERARDLGFDTAALTVPIGHAYLLAGKHEKVLQLLPEGQALSLPDRAYLLALHGYAFVEAKDPEQARAAFDNALAIQPGLEFALLGQVRLALAQADLETASAKLDAALDANPQSVEALILSGEVASLQGQREEAEAAYSKALEFDPANAEALAQRALVRISLGEIDAAGKDVMALTKIAPEKPKTYYVSGLYHYARKEYPQAQEALDKLINRQPNHDRGLLLLGTTNLALNNEAQGLHYLERFISRNPGSVEGASQLVATYLRRGEDQRAQQLLDATLRVRPDDVRLLALRALVSLAGGRVDEASKYLRIADRVDPNAPGLQLGMGLMLMESGDAEGAIDALNKAVEADGEAEVAENARILAYLKAGNPTQALAAAQALASRTPNNQVRQNLVGYVLYTMGRTDEAKAAFERSLAIAPGDPVASQNLAFLALKNGSVADARALYLKVLDRHPQHVPTLVRLGLLEQSAGEPESGIARLQEALALDAGAVDARLALARYQFASGSREAAAALLAQSPPRLQMHPSLLAERAKVHAALGQTESAIDLLMKLTGQYPSLTAAWLQLGLLQEQVGDGESAAIAFLKAMQYEENDPLFGATIARGLYRTGRHDQAREMFRRLQDQNPEDLNVRLLAGWLEQQAGRNEAALSIYRALYEERRTKAVTMMLADAYRGSGEADKAMDVLRQWIEQHPDDQQVSVALAQLQMNAGQNVSAAETLTRLLVYRPTDIGLMNDIAQLLREQDPPKALEFARRAYKMAPEEPAVMDTLGVLLLDDGSVQESVQVLGRAASARPDDPAIRLHFARALVADNATLRGRAELEQLLARYPNAPESRAAQALLDRLAVQ